MALKLLKIILIQLLVLLQALPAFSSDLNSALQIELANISKRFGAKGQLALLLTDLSNNQKIIEINPDLLLKPASTLKLLTSYTALNLLGPEYSYKTNIYSSAIDSSGQVNELVIQGTGDPDFKIEELIQLVRTLKLRGIKKIENLVLDYSLFETEQGRTGIRAYETSNNALAFNFNSIAFEICPRQPGKSASVTWDPYELNLQIEGSIKTVRGQVFNTSIEELGNNKYKISGQIGSDLDCKRQYRAIHNAKEFFAHTLQKILLEHSIKVSRISHKIQNTNLPLLFVMQSKSLASIIDDLNHFSNNFTAQQIVYALGKNDQEKFDYQIGLQNIIRQADQLLGTKDSIKISDGSGLSHDNRIPARLLLAVLDKVWKNSSLRVEFERSLAVLGRSGTLKDRPKLQRLQVRGKTGSINGVNALAGYIYKPDIDQHTRVYAFVMLQNIQTDRVVMLQNEEEILRILDMHL